VGTPGSPYSLDGRGYVDFNVDLVLLGMFNVAFFHQNLNVLRDCISWIFVKLFPRDYALSERRFFIFFLYSDVF